MTKRSLESEEDVKGADVKGADVNGPFKLGFSDPSGATVVFQVIGTTSVGELLADLRQALGHKALSLCLDFDYDAKSTVADLIQQGHLGVKAITRVLVHTPPFLHCAAVQRDSGVFDSGVTVPVELNDDHTRLFVPSDPENAICVSLDPDTNQWQVEDHLDVDDIDPVDHPDPDVRAFFTYSHPLRCTTTFKVVYHINVGIVWIRNDPLCIGLGKQGDTARYIDLHSWSNREVIHESDWDEFDSFDAFKNGITALDVEFAEKVAHIELLCRYDEVERCLTVRHLHRPSVVQFSSVENHPCLIVGLTYVDTRDNGHPVTSSVVIEAVSDEEAAIFDLSIEEQTRRYKQARAAEVREYATRQVEIEVERVLR